MTRPKRFDFVDDDPSVLNAQLRAVRVGMAWEFGFRFLQSAGGPAEDLTGKAFVLQVRDMGDGRTLLLEATTLSGLVVNGGVTGIVSGLLPPLLTARLRQDQRYWYGLAEVGPPLVSRMEGYLDAKRAPVR